MSENQEETLPVEPQEQENQTTVAPQESASRTQSEDENPRENNEENQIQQNEKNQIQQNEKNQIQQNEENQNQQKEENQNQQKEENQNQQKEENQIQQKEKNQIQQNEKNQNQQKEENQIPQKKEENTIRENLLKHEALPLMRMVHPSSGVLEPVIQSTEPVKTAAFVHPPWNWYTTASQVQKFYQEKGITAQGKNVVVTGTTVGGVGFEIARSFLEMGANVLLVMRSQEKAQKAIETLNRSQTNLGTVDWVEADFFELDSVRKVAPEIQKKFSTIHYLVLNAGIYQTGHYIETKDGYEEQIQVNFLAQYLLFTLLIEPLKKAQKARVLVACSENHNFADLYFQDFSNHGKVTTYWPYWCHCRSNTARGAFVYAANKKYEAETGISFFAIYPGSVRSNYYSRYEHTPETKTWKFIDDKFHIWKSPEQGASTFIHVAFFPNPRTGSYWYDNKIQGFNTSCKVKDDKILQVADELVKEK